MIRWLADDIGVAVVGAAVELPTERQRAVDVVPALSPEELHRVGTGSVHVSEKYSGAELAAAAGLHSLRSSGVDPQSIGFLAHAWLYHQGHDFGSPAHYVAHQVGALRSVPVGIQQMSNGGAIGLNLALRMISSAGPGQAALVTTGDRFSLPGFNRWTSDYDVAYGDGGTAVVLRAGDPRPGELEVLAMATTAMPELEVMYRSGDDFSASPLAHATPIDIRRPKRAWLAGGGAVDLAKSGPAAVEDVLTCAISSAGLDAGDSCIRLVALPRIGSRTIEQMYMPPLRRILGAQVTQLGDETGHLGAGDFLANISDLSSGALDANEVGVIIGGGGGFTLSCMVLRRR